MHLLFTLAAFITSNDNQCFRLLSWALFMRAAASIDRKAGSHHLFLHARSARDKRKCLRSPTPDSFINYNRVGWMRQGVCFQFGCRRERESFRTHRGTKRIPKLNPSTPVSSLLERLWRGRLRGLNFEYFIYARRRRTARTYVLVYAFQVLPFPNYSRVKRLWLLWNLKNSPGVCKPLDCCLPNYNGLSQTIRQRHCIFQTCAFEALVQLLTCRSKPTKLPQSEFDKLCWKVGLYHQHSRKVRRIARGD